MKLNKSLTKNINKLDTDINNYTKTERNIKKIKEKSSNLNAIKQSSELEMVSKNSKYMVWSILAIIFVIGGIKATRH